MHVITSKHFLYSSEGNALELVKKYFFVTYSGFGHQPHYRVSNGFQVTSPLIDILCKLVSLGHEENR